MKAKTIVHVVAGDIKVAEEMELIGAALGTGKMLGMTRVADHGATKDIIVPANAIVWLERA